MNAKVKVLESLLSRVQKNASVARRVVPAAPAPNSKLGGHGRSSMELDEPGMALGHSVVPDSLDEPVGGITTLPPPMPSAVPPQAAVSLDSDVPPAFDGSPLVPTIEQLGQTVSLEEGPDMRLEVERAMARVSDSPSPPSARGLEAAIPSRPSATAFDLPAPPEAREELERYRLGQSQEVVVDAYARPTISTNVVDLVTAQREFQPATFAELLDASLKL
jgi:hypothetical protein